ncbi:uncharacterized protein LOC121407321 isoform X2 [Lytechinus variegatus]|uniref:uncharacterized protein LOC121407321 isoform X2 n=1 Tax=Lytechinus variegatus TaxID=7654 RepID=UPI001BB18C67|nr:uncharacterized protein LOC121407321 isoform X2 [Lytechinus variegatus]
MLSQPHLICRLVIRRWRPAAWQQELMLVVMRHIPPSTMLQLQSPPPSLLLSLPSPLPPPLPKTTPDTKPPSPQLTRYCSWRRIYQELQSQGLPVSYNKKNAMGPSNELVVEYLATVVEMQRLTYCHR